ncbi:MAG: tRNA (adenosine(37)-N6)-dimethylallyltransferase MiaA [Bacteroidales bacterium]
MNNEQKHAVMVVILGPTATGKTQLAAHVAALHHGEVISADSRQVYKGMDLGTGKDYEDYTVDGKAVPYHLIDIAEPGQEYNVFKYQQDFLRTFRDITGRDKLPVLCGGTGLYIEAALGKTLYPEVPENPVKRKQWAHMPMEELTGRLRSFRRLHNVTDTGSRERLIRALEIQEFMKDHPRRDFPRINPLIMGIRYDRNTIRKRITERLAKRMSCGMIDEVRSLLREGVDPGMLKCYGLEYRMITWFLEGELTHAGLFQKLNTAIHQFAKRQMTWFRRMERRGFYICWLDGDMDLHEKVKAVSERLKSGV